MAKNEKESESIVAKQVKVLLDQHLQPPYKVRIGGNLLYKIEVSPSGAITPGSLDDPMRGQYAFQTDILIERRSISTDESSPLIPLVVIELKSGNFSSHDIITYSSKAARHKEVYPYLRYGFVVVGGNWLGRRFVTHNEAFDFAMSAGNLEQDREEFVSMVDRQLASAETLCKLAESEQLRLLRYEEVVQVTLSTKGQKVSAGITEGGLKALAQFLPIFSAPGFVAGTWSRGQETEPGVIQMPFVSYIPEVNTFVDAAYKKKWIKEDFNWGDWMSTEEACRLRDDPSLLAKASPDQLGKLLTVMIRQDRFAEGALLDGFETGLVLRIVQRAAAILQKAALSQAVS